MSHQDPRIDDNGASLDAVIPIPADYAAAIGSYELWTMTDQMQTALYALAWARMDDAHDAKAWGSTLQHIDRLQDRLDAIRSHAIRHHKANGGSVADLGMWLDMPKSTAQHVQQKALNDSGRYTMWVTQRHDERQQPEPGSEWWKRTMEARLRRAINTNNAELLAEVTKAAQEHGMHPTELLTVDQPDEITEREETALLHLAVVALTGAQIDRLPASARESYLKMTNRIQRAKAVVALYAGMSRSSITADQMQTIDQAYELATHIVETEATDDK